MTWLDSLVIGFIGLSLVFGLAKGFVRSILGLAATIAGLFLAVAWYPEAASLLRRWVETDVTAQFIAFLSIFAGVLMMGIVLGRALRRVLEKVHLSWIDHLAGGAFGFLRGWLICSIIYIALTAFSVQPEIVARATLTPFLLRGADILTRATSQTLRNNFLEGYERLHADGDRFSSG